LWNGSYFIQQVRMPDDDQRLAGQAPPRHPPGIRPGEPEPRYQYGPGCLSDQLLGQWFADVVGLGHLVDADKVRSTIQSIVRHNFKPSLATHESCQRGYALNDEAGLLVCTWPNGGRPRYPFPYADEVWTGMEYEVAALAIYEGMVDEGISIVEGVRARHDGWRRNPWDEFECGHHYARALSSWSVLLALSGYHYHAPAGLLGFDPRVNANDFRGFFSTGQAWGRFQQTVRDGQLRAGVQLREGTLTLRALRLGWPGPAAVSLKLAHLGAGDVSATATLDHGATLVRFDPPISLVPGAASGLELRLAAGVEG
ncbi:MAG: GH116 family glycosyl hydrolase, partial [Streptosporangiaceae bacterium]